MRHLQRALFVATFLFLVTNTTFANPVSGRVSWVYDGDTLEIHGMGKVRLLGIDTPELLASERDTPYVKSGVSSKLLRKVACEATAYVIRTAKNQIVTLEFDRERTDAYGRILAYVTLPDGRMLNRELIRKGLAAAYRRFDHRLKDDFFRIEAQAREAECGLWREEAK